MMWSMGLCTQHANKTALMKKMQKKLYNGLARWHTRELKMGKENSNSVCSPFNNDNVERHFVLFAAGKGEMQL